MPDQHTAAKEHQLTQELLSARDELPEDPTAAVEPPEFQIARRGYDREEVDAYVDRVFGIVQDLAALRSPREAIRQALDRVGDETSDILRRAHETAEEITHTSRAEAHDRIQTAHVEAERMIREAEERVAQLDRDADLIWQERDKILADVRRLSAELDRVGHAADERFPPEAPAPGAPAGGEGAGAVGALSEEDIAPADATIEADALREDADAEDAGPPTQPRGPDPAQ